MNVIESESLTKIYKPALSRKGKIVALNNVSIQVERGEIFSLLGPNGAGKTTFIKILLSLTHPTSGSASILGARLPNVPVRKQLGYLPESHRYPGYLTGNQVLQLFGSLSGLTRRHIHTRISPLLDLVGMKQWAHTKVKKYSKGMMQRLGLAQAIINDPDVLFLDEPTDGVDPVGRKEIRDLLLDLKNKGKTIFLNSHLLSEVELISDRVAILDKGLLLRVATVDELTSASPEYEILVNSVIPEDVHHELNALRVKMKVEENKLTVNAGTVGEVNGIIDSLRRHGVEIITITKKRSSLEESFINLIRKEVTV